MNENHAYSVTTTVLQLFSDPFETLSGPSDSSSPERERRFYERIVRISAYLETATNAPAVSPSMGIEILNDGSSVRDRNGLLYRHDYDLSVFLSREAPLPGIV